MEEERKKKGSLNFSSPRRYEGKRKRRRVTVWVHGTRMIARGLLPYFYRAFPGLQHISDIMKEVGDYHNNVQIATSLSNCDPENFPLDSFHFFGWSGHLSEKARMDEAIVLRKSLIELLSSTPGYLDDKEEENEKEKGEENEEKTRTKREKPPKLTIITHSHGGNLVFNMVELEDKERKERKERKEKKKKGDKLKRLTKLKGRSFEVNKLVLLACPILDAKKDLAADRMFKRVISLYSAADLTQLLGSSSWFKKQSRLFPESSNLIQTEVGYTSHISFVKEGFLKKLPTLLEELLTTRSISSSIPLDEETSPSDNDEFKREYGSDEEDN